MGYHVPVLAEQVCEALGPALRSEGAIYVDATCGGGGHARAVIEAFSPARVVLIDRDPDAIAHAREWTAELGVEVQLHHAPFSDLAAIVAEVASEGVHAILADLGVSSHQLDTAERGFSFRRDGPLDMRMDPSRGKSAAELIAECEVDELAAILREFGEEPQARRIARELVRGRPETTAALSELVHQVVRPRHGQRVDPATRTFQALRIAVNTELDELTTLLEAAPELLVVGGRLGIITFHSLEDRPVKRRFAELSKPPALPRHLPVPEHERPRPRFAIPRDTKNPALPREDEVDANPRARSAKLRVLERRAA